MKVRHVVQVSSYYPPHLGGQENAVHDLAEQLANAGWRVNVLTSTIGASLNSTVKKTGVRVKRLWGFVFGHAPIMPYFPIALFKTAKKDSLVHIHIGQAFTPEVVWLVSKLRGFKYVAQLHIDFEPSGPAGILLPLYKRLVLRRVLRSAAAIITLNQKTLRIVRNSYGYTGDVRVMNNGLDDSYFMLNRPSLPPKPPDCLNLLFVGRLDKQKNVGALLEALKLTHQNVHLDIVGDGAEAESIKNTIAKLGLINVTLHGKVVRSEVMEFYKTCDALIMPSLYEAQPLTLLEAMAARIPIIGTRVIGVEDHLKSAAILVMPTPAGLAEGIDQYYTSYALLPKMVQRAHNTAEKLRWPHTLKKYEALYEQALAH